MINPKINLLKYLFFKLQIFNAKSAKIFLTTKRF